MSDLQLMTSGDLGDESRRSPRSWGFAEDLGRYWLPDPGDPAAWEPGSIGARHFPRGFMRTTNLISAYSDTRALSVWEQSKMLRGLRARPDLYAELSVADRDENGDLTYRESRRIAEAALRAGGADAAALQGVAQHRVLEHRLLTGELIGTPEMQDGQLALEALLKAHLLKPAAEYAERTVVNTHLKCAGRFDVPLWDVGAYAEKGERLLMADLKTKKKQFWSVLEQRAQLAVYARADAMWDEELQCYVTPPPFDLDEGVIMHLPQRQEDLPEEMRTSVQLIRADLRKGWATACRAREVVDDRAEAKSAPMLRDIIMRPAPFTTLAQFAARLALVDSLPEGSEVLSLAAEVLDADDMEKLNRAAIVRVHQLTS
jgi:hypothetical protein